MIVYATRGSPFIVAAVESARSWMPDTPILVVDSDSCDTSYYPKVEALGAQVLDSHNTHYELGAWLAAYRASDATYFWFLHDSTVLQRSLATFEALPVTVCGTLENWTGCDTGHTESITSRCSARGWKRSDPFYGAFGSMFGCQRSTMDALVSTGLFDPLPTNKFDSQCAERLTGIALAQTGVNVKAVAWGLGERLASPESPVGKLYGSRT